jgi:protein-tyrosine-phosphatase
MQSFRRRVEQRPEVLFLCKGNICRSPFAARRAAQLWPADVAITEAGTYPVPDRRSPEVARLAAAGMHVDLESHRSTVVTRPLVDRAGVIIVFDWRNLDEITTRWPHIRKKVFLLGELTPGRTTIIDPFGKPARVCDEVYRQIEASLTHIAEQAMPLPHQR